MKILFDTNIILDVLLVRKPFDKHALYLLSQVENKNIIGFLCPTTITTIGYLVTKEKNSKESKRIIKHLLNIFQLTDMNKAVFESACDHTINDYEDAVLHETAVLSNIEGIVTRNIKDFKKSTIKIFSPEELVSIITTSN